MEDQSVTETTDPLKPLREAWEKKQEESNTVLVVDPSGDGLVIYRRMEFEGAKVSIWTLDYEGDEPEYVVVHPPTQYYINKNQLVEDPLVALTVAILGAKR